MTKPVEMILSDALAGKHGPDVQEKAEQAVKAAVDQIGRMVGHGTIVGAAAKAFKANKGGIVSPSATFMVGNGDREHIVPHSVGFKPVGVVVEGPDGALHGKGNVIASADAAAWRPQDCAPALRRAMFGDKQ